MIELSLQVTRGAVVLRLLQLEPDATNVDIDDNVKHIFLIDIVNEHHWQQAELVELAENGAC